MDPVDRDEVLQPLPKGRPRGSTNVDLDTL